MRPRATTGVAFLALLVLACPANATSLRAQSRPDTLYLDDLQRAAEQADARRAQLDLLRRQAGLRLQAIASEHLPSVAGAGTAQYLSDVANVSALIPAARIPSAHNDQYDASVVVRQPLLDLTRRNRAAVEEATLAESQARVRSALYQQRAAVSEAFFGVVAREAQLQAIDAVIADLDGRMQAATVRVSSGAALPSELLLLQAERVRRVQGRDELIGDRDAAREVLAQLVGRDLPRDALLRVRPGVAGAAPAPADADTMRARPEFAQFDRTHAVLEARRAAIAAQDLPRVSLVGRTGYGRPGLNPLARRFDSYWSAGVQVDWTLWNWGRTRRDVEVQSVQDDIVRADEAAFRASLRRVAVQERSRVSTLELALVADDSIVALRERILRETRLRYDEGEANAADYIARLTEHLTARLDRDARRVRLDEARARYLTTLGLEVR